MIKIQVNGEIVELAAGSAISDAVQILGMDNANIVAELDGDIVKRESFSVTKLYNGARLELVRFVGGG